MPQRRQPHEIEGLQRDIVSRQGAQHLGHGLQGRLLARDDAGGERVALDGGRGEQSVHHQVVAGGADRGQFLVRASHLAERRGLCPCDEHHAGPAGVGECVDRRLVLRALLVEPGERPEAGGVALPGVQKPAPRARQLQQADGVPGRRRVEDDVVVPGGDAGVGQQVGELVEGGNLGRAGARELLLDALHHIVRQDATHRADDAIAIALRRRFRIDLERGQARHVRNGRHLVADRQAEDLPDVRGRVGAHEQHARAGIGQLHRGGAGNRRLADAALAGEEHVAGESRRGTAWWCSCLNSSRGPSSNWS